MKHIQTCSTYSRPGYPSPGRGSCSGAAEKIGRKNRRGVAAAELAVCLPIIVLLVLGAIEACTMVFLKQSLSVAAYEGVRVAIGPTATAADVDNAAQQILTERRVNSGTVAIGPRSPASLNPGEYLTITVSAPAASNSVVPISFYRGRTITATATMMKEF